MKNLKTIAIALLVAFGTVNAQTKKVDVAKSTISWVGKKVTGQHEGTVNLKEGNLIFKGKKVVGGNFTVDMTSMTTTDLKAGQGKEKLDGHLKSEDFFGTEKFQTATFIKTPIFIDVRVVFQESLMPLYKIGHKEMLWMPPCPRARN